MSSKVVRLIEGWFAECDDGEFLGHARGMPYSIIGPGTGAATVLFTTKAAAVFGALGKVEVPKELAVVGGYGLPHVLDVEWISGMAERLLFLGDMDPPDLMIFAWLRARCSIETTFLGVSDRLFRTMRLPLTKLPSVPLCLSEQESLSIIEGAVPDLQELVGPKSAAHLKRGGKVELEGVLGATKNGGRAILRLVRF